MSDVDDPLRRYRPAGPPPDLRARIVLAVDHAPPTRLRDWLPAVAAAALIVLLQVLASGIRDRVYDQIIAPEAPAPIEVPLQ
jgi:hypothetical protein